MKHDMKYKVGDKVRIVSRWVPGCHQNSAGLMDHWLGKVMTVRSVEKSSFSGDYKYTMKEDQNERAGFGWVWHSAAIAGLACERKIVVTSDGKVTTAKLFDGKQLVKAATAKCSDGDTFDFATGAALAIERLLPSKEKAEPEKLFPLEEIKAGYLLCVKNDDGRCYNMTVVPSNYGGLGCCNPKHSDYWPLSEFDHSLRYVDSLIVAVYGPACNADLLKNSTEDRELLWSRK